jgi:hypothetical protein
MRRAGVLRLRRSAALEERIILSLITEDRQRYSDIRDKLGHVFPCGLLENIGASDFLYFDADWTPQAYDGIRHIDSPPVSPMSSGGRRCANSAAPQVG